MHLNNFLPIKTIIILLTIPFTATALLTAQTSQYIMGDAPSLNQQLLSEMKEQKFSLLGFKYNNITYNQKNIKEFKLNSTFNKYTTTPKELYTELQALLVQDLQPEDATDKNGDSSFSLSSKNWNIQIQDANNINISEETLSFCELSSKYQAPYHISVSAELVLKTKYGVPNSQHYSKTDGLKKQPQNNLLLDIGGVCYAQPELTAGYPGPSNLWAKDKGFLVQSTIDYTQNFPSVGFDGAEFVLKIYGIDATKQEWNALADTPNSNISATVIAIDSDTVQITLEGPIADSSSSRIRFSGPSQFRIQNVTTNTTLYGFTINRWFIATTKPDQFSVTKTYCEAGGNYSLPSIKEITTAVTLNTESTTRKMGALIAEWGDVTQYTKSQFHNWPVIVHEPFWSKDSANVTNANMYRMVMPRTGNVGYNDISDPNRRYGKLCINN